MCGIIELTNIRETCVRAILLCNLISLTSDFRYGAGHTKALSVTWQKHRRWRRLRSLSTQCVHAASLYRIWRHRAGAVLTVVRSHSLRDRGRCHRHCITCECVVQHCEKADNRPSAFKIKCWLCERVVYYTCLILYIPYKLEYIYLYILFLYKHTNYIPKNTVISGTVWIRASAIILFSSIILILLLGLQD